MKMDVGLGSIMTTTPKRQFKPSRVITPISDDLKKKHKIQSTGDRPKFVRLLLSGLGGQGKTTIIGTASRRVLIDNEWTLPYNNVLLIEYDPDGDDTIVAMRAEVDRIQSPNEKDLLDALRFAATSKEAEQYDVVALDSYNRFQDMEIDTVLPVGNALSAKRRSAPRLDTEVMEIQDYGRLNKRQRIINDHLHVIKKHIIVTCIMGFKDHPLEMDKPKEDRRQITSLALDGKQAHLLSTQFSLHGIVTKDGAGSNLKVKTIFNQYNSEAKTRFRMEHDCDNITFPDIMQMVGIEDPAFKKIEWIQDKMGFLPQYVGANGTK